MMKAHLIGVTIICSHINICVNLFSTLQSNSVYNHSLWIYERFLFCRHILSVVGSIGD